MKQVDDNGDWGDETISGILRRDRKEKLNLNKLIDLSFNLIDAPDGPCKHFTFIVRKNKILSIGWNSYSKTHPVSVKFGSAYKFRHSEVHAVSKFPGEPSELSRCKLYNTRVNRHGEVCMSRPCKYCLPMLVGLNFREVMFTNTNGQWVCL